jgi:hypothetical protein
MEFDAERYYHEMLNGEHFDELVNLTDSQLEQLCAIGMQYEKLREATNQLH